MSDQSNTAVPFVLAGAPNSRDLGGHRGTDGRVVRSGIAFRAEALADLTDTDVATVRGLGVRTIVDYRGAGEVAMSGPDRWEAASPITRLILPVFAHDHDIYTALALLMGRPDDSEAEDVAGRESTESTEGMEGMERMAAELDRVFGDGGAERLMLDIYRGFVSDRATRLPFARTLQLLGDPAGTPLLFHCTAGKDRTGWMAAILLTALGVDADAVLDDYLLSNRHHAFDLGRFEAEGPSIDPELVRPLVEVRPDYLQAGFDQIEKDFGTFDRFVERGLGIDTESLRQLRDNLLER